MTMGPHPDGLTVRLTSHGGIVYDVSFWVEYVLIRRGKSDPLDRYRAGTVELGLRNTDGRFSPWNPASPIGQILPNWKIDVRVGSADWLITAYLDRVAEDRRGDGREQAVILGTDGFKLLALATDEALVSAVGASELPGARISRILTAAGWPDGSDLDTGNPALTATTLADAALDELFAVSDSEPGHVLIGRDGTFLFWDADHTQTSWTTSQATFADYPDEGEIQARRIVPNTDDSLVVNRVQLTNVEDEDTLVEDNTSIGVYGTRAWARSGLWYTDDTHGADVGQVVLDRSANSIVRVDNLEVLATVDVNPPADPVWDALAGLELHDRVTVRQNVAGYLVEWDAYVESIEHRIETRQWRAIYGLSPVIDGSQTTTVVAVDNLTITPACTSARFRWTLTGVAQFVDVKVEETGSGTGSWVRFPGGLAAITWRNLEPDTGYTVFVRVVAGDGSTSTTTSDTFTTTECAPPDVDPDDGDVTQPPSTGITCDTGWTRTIQWTLSLVEPEIGLTELDTGYADDDGTAIDFRTGNTLLAYATYRLCTRVGCRNDTTGVFTPSTDWECTDWVEPVSWANSCARSAGDDFETVANDEGAGEAAIWVDWCPGDILWAPAYRNPDTLATDKVNIWAGPNLQSLIEGPDLGSGDPSLMGYGPGVDGDPAVLAVGELDVKDFNRESQSWKLTTWFKLTDWASGPAGALAYVAPLISIGNGIVISAVRLTTNMFAIAVEVLVDDDGTDRWAWVASIGPYDSGTKIIQQDTIHRLDITWDEEGDVTLAIDGTYEWAEPVTWTLQMPDDILRLSVPPGGALGQVLLWDTLEGVSDTPYADAVLADSPVGYWKLVEGSGGTGTTLEDYGSAMADLSLGVGNWGTDGPVDEGIWLNDVYTATSPVEAGTEFSASSFTLEFLIRPENLSATDAIFSKWDDSTWEEWTVLITSSEIIRFSIGNTSNANWRFVVGTTSLTPQTWYHVACRYDAGSNEISIWINGTKTDYNTDTAVGTRRGNSGSVGVRIGSYWDTTTVQLDGGLCHVAYYGSALSDARILAHAEAGGFA